MTVLCLQKDPQKRLPHIGIARIEIDKSAPEELVGRVADPRSGTPPLPTPFAEGTLPLMDRINGIEELLEPGRDVVCYGSTEEAVELANRYLKDSAARAAIVARGRARVLAEHTYTARLDTLCRIARQ